jgi:hypothetical protein
MATLFNFDGKIISLPGVYGNIKSGVVNPPVAQPYGDVLIIDTGSGAGFGGGSGINGQLYQDKNTIYEFDNLPDFEAFCKGGLWWLLGNPLFNPAGPNFQGVSKIYFIKAATTTAAKLNFTFWGDGHRSISETGSPNGGTLNILCLDEGVVGNGVLTNGVLSQGYAGIMTPGKLNPSAFILSFYLGSFTGLDQNGLPYNGVYPGSTTPTLVAQSPEFTNISTVITWMQQDATFNKYFKLTASTISGSGLVDSHDLEDYSSYELAYGGTESYADPSHILMNRVLTAVENMVINYVFADQWGSSATSATNELLANYVVNQNKYKPQLWIGGGDSANDFVSNSLNTASFYNQDSVTVVHGAIYINSLLGQRTYNVMYQTAAVLGREAGLEPQIPITFKNISVDGEVHKLTNTDATKALAAGVIAVWNQDGAFEIIKGITSLQNNQFLINNDGTISSQQLKRVTRQVNLNMIVNGKLLFKNPKGTNRNTLSVIDLVNWAQTELKSMIATPQADNLILSFLTPTVTRRQDGYYLKYKFTPNTEISFLFETGVVIGV